MPGGGLAAVIVGAVIAGAAMLKRRYVNRDALWVRRILAREKITSADDLIDGVRGTTRGTVIAMTGLLLRAPLSDRSCVFWQLRFEEVGARDLVERARLQQRQEFLIATSAGTARVIPDGAVVDLPPHVVDRPAIRLRGGDRDHVYEVARAADVTVNHTSSILRAIETVILPGMTITVSGGCVREPDPSAQVDVSGYRDQLPTRPVLSGTRRAPILIGAVASPSPAAGRT